jgi:Bacteroidetes VLRF1 release factor
LWFSADAAFPDTQIGLYRAIFSSSGTKRRLERPADEWRVELNELQVTPEVPKSKKFAATATGPVEDPTDFEARNWTMLMVGGGHFAAMVVSLVPKIVNKGGGRMEREEVVLEKKTFHRYTSECFSSFVLFAREPTLTYAPFARSSSEARWLSIYFGQRERKREERRRRSSSLQRTSSDRCPFNVFPTFVD